MKRIFLLSIAIMMAIVLGATERSEQDAAALAAKFFTSVPQRKMATASSTAAPMMRKAHTVSMPESKQPALYVFNRMVEDQAQGYAVVAAVEGVDMILGYSETGAIDEIPAPMQMWLEAYAEEIAMIERGEAQAKTSARTLTPTEAISPMVQCEWGQFDPFNNLTPAVVNPETEESEHCVSGCVATALAQIMYYWRYANPQGQHISYYWEAGGKTIETDLHNGNYDWTNMLTKYDGVSYTDVQAEAVALLIKDLGYASKMNFDVDGSGTYPYEGINALITYFGYDKSVSLIRSKCLTPDPASGATSATKNDQLDELIYEEMKAGRPVLASAVKTEGGGHAFVIDGIDANGKFHINWGWDGSANGYYLLETMVASNSTETRSYLLDRQFYTHIVPANDPDHGATGEYPHDYRVEVVGFKAKIGSTEITGPIAITDNLTFTFSQIDNINFPIWLNGSEVNLQIFSANNELLTTVKLIEFINADHSLTGLGYNESYNNDGEGDYVATASLANIKAALTGLGLSSDYYILKFGYGTKEADGKLYYAPMLVKDHGFEPAQFKLFIKSDTEATIAPIATLSTYDASLTGHQVEVAADQWQLVAFPFANTKPATQLFEYDGDARAALGVNGWLVTTSANLVRGNGYMVKGEATLDVSATNASNEALSRPYKDMTLSLKAYSYASTATCNKGWNLVGNPYAAQYSLTQLSNDGFTNAVTTFDSETGTYAVNSPIVDLGSYIEPYQAFFVQVESDIVMPFKTAGVNFSFGSQASVPARKQDPKSEKTAIPSVKLYLGNADFTDHTQVAWYADATEDYDINYDGQKWFSERTDIAQVYTVGGDAKYAVNIRPEAQEMIAVGMVLPKDGEYTFSAVNTDMEVYLYDARFDISHDITKSAYTFDGVAGTDEARFALIFGHKLPTDLEKAQITNHQLPIKRVVDGQLLIINPASAHVYNAQGQMIR